MQSIGTRVFSFRSWPLAGCVLKLSSTPLDNLPLWSGGVDPRCSWSHSRTGSWQCIGCTHLKFNIAPEKLPSQKESNKRFQPSIFRGYVKLRGCKNSHKTSCPFKRAASLCFLLSKKSIALRMPSRPFPFSMLWG